MARYFNGSEGATMTAPSIATFDKLTLSWWMYDDSNGASEKISLSSTPGSQGSFNSFIFEPRWFGGNNVIVTGMSGPGIGVLNNTYAQPTAAVWHHYLWVMDRAAKTHALFVDGILKTPLTTGSNANGFGNFADSTWEFMGYGGSFRWPGRLADLAVWGVKWGLGEAMQLAKGVSPLTVRPDRLVMFIPFQGTQREPVYGRGGVLLPNFLVFTGTTGVAHPLGQRTLVRPKRKALAIV